MRYAIYAASAMVAFALAGAAPASASRTDWVCQGPAASCVKETPARSAKAVYAKSYKKAASAKYRGSKKVAYKSYKSKKSYASKSSGSIVSTGGGSRGVASYYWQPQRVASGGWFNPNAMTAAHKTLPFGTRVVVTNLRNGRSVTVTINDRGPYVKGRVIDLSRAAASSIGMTGAGVAPVSYSVVGRG